ncbi:MAG: DUF58 domain-containing protein [bacterium]|nr:DUF58 domain-containing protein [bacterium]
MSPAPRLLWLLGVWLILAVAVAFAPSLLIAWKISGGVLAGLATIDAMVAWFPAPANIERIVSHNLSVGDWTPVIVRAANLGARRLDFTLHDHHPTSAEVRGVPSTISLAAGENVEISYQIYPRERGIFIFEPPAFLIRSPFRFWVRRRRLGPTHEVRVYPNFRAVMKYNLLATDNRTSALGIRRRPRRGEGLDFLQLREYRDGDSLRQIDWKATLRLRKTISREYQDERDQQIVFLLDCGRKMHSRDDELSHFDHALNSVLLLAHVALRQGDAVGLSTFSGPERWLAPRKGTGHLNAMLNSVFDLQTSTQASDYVSAAQGLARRVNKRALVVLVSNLRDEDHEELALAARLLGRKHLVLLASMKEAVLAKTLAQPVQGFESALRVAATHQYAHYRRRAHENLRRTGVLSLDVEPQQLAVALVNGYLDIKSRGVL